MKSIILNGYQFYYADNMIYFNDQRYNNILFMKTIGPANNGLNAYDGAQLIVEFKSGRIRFHPIWNIIIDQVDNKTYILSTE